MTDILNICKDFHNVDGELIKSIKQTKLELSELPYDLDISTATITCHIDINFNTENIGLYFNDFDDILVGKKFGNRIINNLVNINNDIKPKKINIKKQNKLKMKEESKKNFYNQVSFIFNSATLFGLDLKTLPEKDKDKTVNVKLFRNGAIQMTGCKHPENVYNSLKIIFEKLKKTRAILNDNFEFVEKTYIDDIEKLKIENVKNFCIRMINTNFNINFHINRNKLFELLLKNGYDANFDPIIHAGGVSVKYALENNKSKIISLFIFESGSITIAGCNSPREIKETYYFINKFILSHYDELVSTDITPKVILQLLKKLNAEKI